jgi:hypothetical protein
MCIILDGACVLALQLCILYLVHNQTPVETVLVVEDKDAHLYPYISYYALQYATPQPQRRLDIDLEQMDTITLLFLSLEANESKSTSSFLIKCSC